MSELTKIKIVYPAHPLFCSLAIYLDKDIDHLCVLYICSKKSNSSDLALICFEVIRNNYGGLAFVSAWVCRFYDCRNNVIFCRYYDMTCHNYVIILLLRHVHVIINYIFMS